MNHASFAFLCMPEGPRSVSRPRELLELLTVSDVAAITRLSVGTLRWRHTGSRWPSVGQVGAAGALPPRRRRDLAEAGAMSAPIQRKLPGTPIPHE